MKILRGILYVCAFFSLCVMIFCNAWGLFYPRFVEMTPEITNELVEINTMGFRHFVQGFLLLIFLKVTK